MAFNVQITRIEDTVSAKTRTEKKQTGRVVASQHNNGTLISVPVDHSINKYPVRIFEVQPQE